MGLKLKSSLVALVSNKDSSLISSCLVCFFVFFVVCILTDYLTDLLLVISGQQLFSLFLIRQMISYLSVCEITLISRPTRLEDCALFGILHIEVFRIRLGILVACEHIVCFKLRLKTHLRLGVFSVMLGIGLLGNDTLLKAAHNSIHRYEYKRFLMSISCGCIIGEIYLLGDARTAVHGNSAILKHGLLLRSLMDLKKLKICFSSGLTVIAPYAVVVRKLLYRFSILTLVIEVVYLCLVCLYLFFSLLYVGLKTCGCCTKLAVSSFLSARSCNFILNSYKLLNGILLIKDNSVKMLFFVFCESLFSCTSSLLASMVDTCEAGSGVHSLLCSLTYAVLFSERLIRDLILNIVMHGIRNTKAVYLIASGNLFNAYDFSCGSNSTVCTLNGCLGFSSLGLGYSFGKRCSVSLNILADLVLDALHVRKKLIINRLFVIFSLFVSLLILNLFLYRVDASKALIRANCLRISGLTVFFIVAIRLSRVKNRFLLCNGFTVAVFHLTLNDNGGVRILFGFFGLCIGSSAVNDNLALFYHGVMLTVLALKNKKCLVEILTLLSRLLRFLLVCKLFFDSLSSYIVKTSDFVTLLGNCALLCVLALFDAMLKSFLSLFLFLGSYNIFNASVSLYLVNTSDTLALLGNRALLCILAVADAALKILLGLFFFLSLCKRFFILDSFFIVKTSFFFALLGNRALLRILAVAVVALQSLLIFFSRSLSRLISSCHSQNFRSVARLSSASLLIIL